MRAPLPGHFQGESSSTIVHRSVLPDPAAVISSRPPSRTYSIRCGKSCPGFSNRARPGDDSVIRNGVAGRPNGLAQ